MLFESKRITLIKYFSVQTHSRNHKQMINYVDVFNKPYFTVKLMRSSDIKKNKTNEEKRKHTGPKFTYYFNLRQN